MQAKARYKVTTCHGERETIYHVVDSQATESEQPAIIASYGTGKYAGKAHSHAAMCRDVHNERQQRKCFAIRSYHKESETYCIRAMRFTSWEDAQDTIANVFGNQADYDAYVWEVMESNVHGWIGIGAMNAVGTEAE